MRPDRARRASGERTLAQPTYFGSALFRPGLDRSSRDNSAHRDVGDVEGIEARFSSPPVKAGVRLSSPDDFPAPWRAEGDPDGSGRAVQGTYGVVAAAVVNVRPAIIDRAGDGELTCIGDGGVTSSRNHFPVQFDAHGVLEGRARTGITGRAGRRGRVRLCVAPEDRD